MQLSTILNSSRSRLLIIVLSLVLMSSVAYFFNHTVPRPSLWYGLSDVTNISDHNVKTPDLHPGEVVMVTASEGSGGFQGIPGLKEMIYENRMTYAHRWGHEFMWANITSYNHGPKVVWNKIPILQDAWARFPNAKWIWWLDIDIIIMTHSVDLQAHVLSHDGMRRNLLYDTDLPGVGGGPLGFKSLADPNPEDVNFLIAADAWGMNAGSFLMRRGEWTDWVLEMWDDPLAIAQDWVFAENDGWTHLFTKHQMVRDHTGNTHQRALNSYPHYNGLGEHWEEGDLVVHFAGCGGGPDCAKNWDDMWVQRENYTVPEFIQEELANGTAKIEWVQKGIPI